MALPDGVVIRRLQYRDTLQYTFTYTVRSAWPRSSDETLGSTGGGAASVNVRDEASSSGRGAECVSRGRSVKPAFCHAAGSEVGGDTTAAAPRLPGDPSAGSDRG